MFIPTTPKEMKQRGWSQCDVILITGDTYIDSPHIGIAVIGKVLMNAGYRVGIIAQPDISSDELTRLGEPKLFWGITAGSVDSLVANYTATKKFRKRDDYTPGGMNNRRPDRASIVYSNLIRRCFKNTKPIVLGGIEASLRRIAHYDYWSDKIRRSILFDAKADYLIYGMAEKTILEFSRLLKDSKDLSRLRGLCYISASPIQKYIEVPSFDKVKTDKQAFINMFHTFYRNNAWFKIRPNIISVRKNWIIFTVLISSGQFIPFMQNMETLKRWILSGFPSRLIGDVTVSVIFAQLVSMRDKLFDGAVHHQLLKKSST
jgi:uncharacterized radical SAM protein YgiQ